MDHRSLSMQNTRTQTGQTLQEKWDKWVINRIQSETNITSLIFTLSERTLRQIEETEGEREREREMRKGLFRFLVFVWNIIPLASAAVFFNPLHASFPDLPAKPGNSSIFFFFGSRAAWLPRKRKKLREKLINDSC